MSEAVSLEEQYRTSFETWNKLAEIYATQFHDPGIYRESYDRFCTSIPTPNASVLELGCGPGNCTRYLLNQRKDFRIEATDVSPNMIDFASKALPEVNFSVLDVRNLSQLNTPYHAIFCGFMLPYLSPIDLDTFFDQLARLLNIGGILYLSYIEGDASRNGFEKGSNRTDGCYVFYYTMTELENKLNIRGFSMLNRYLLPYRKSNAELDQHGILIARRDNM